MNEEHSAIETGSESARRRRRRAVRNAGPPANVPDVDSPAPSAGESVSSGAKPVQPSRGAPETTSTAATGDAPGGTAVLAEPSVGAASKESRRRRRWLHWLVRGAATVVVVALLAATGWLAFEHRQADARDAKRQQFIQAGRQTALNLTSIHVDTAKQDVERILENATGSFKAEFDGRIDPFVSVVEAAKVNTDGEIIEAGLERESGATADVLVAARSMVTNAGNDKPEPRDFRLRITVSEIDGRLLTSNVEFVP